MSISYFDVLKEQQEMYDVCVCVCVCVQTSVRQEMLFLRPYIIASKKMICIQYLETHLRDINTLNGHNLNMHYDWWR